MRLLVTGFEPFDKSPLNPSGEVLKQLDPPPPGWEFHTVLLPVAFRETPGAVAAALQRHTPDIHIALGEARGTAGIRLERLAVNLVDYHRPDNLEDTVRDTPLVADGPPAYWATLPIRVIEARLRASGIPTTCSLSAGSHMCNLTLYTSLHWAAQRSTRALTGFVHLPALPAQMARERTPQASMAIELQQAAVQIVITESCRVFDVHHGEAQSP